VYLYIINYSRDKPDDSIMVVNLFRKDMENKGTINNSQLTFICALLGLWFLAKQFVFEKQPTQC